MVFKLKEKHYRLTVLKLQIFDESVSNQIGIHLKIISCDDCGDVGVNCGDVGDNCGDCCDCC